MFNKKIIKQIISLIALMSFFSEFYIFADTKVLKGILVKEYNQKVINGIPLKQEAPVVRGILISPPTVYATDYYDDDTGAIIGFGVALGVTALLLGISSHHYHGHHYGHGYHSGYRHSYGRHHGYRHHY